MSVSLASLGCLLLAASASAYVCSDFTSAQCSASTVFATIRNSYLVASTGEAPQLTVPTYLTRISGIHQAYVRLFIRSHGDQDTCTVKLPGRPDHYVLQYGSDPYPVHALRVPFAEYNNCWVAQFDDDRFGCRLWVRQNAHPRIVNRCLRGLARVCPGPLYTAWNRQCLRGCSSRWNQLPWGVGFQQQPNRISWGFSYQQPPSQISWGFGGQQQDQQDQQSKLLA